jgi:type II secretory pathway pseudopilin PulG
VTQAGVPPTPADEQGFVLIEILVSALVLAIVAGAVVTLLNATGRAGAQERRRSQAYAVAQEDQARLRAMRLTSLNNLKEENKVTMNGTTFTVVSTGVFVNNKSGSTSCTTGEVSADYVVIGTRVTWPSGGSTSPAATIKSILSPANGSLDPTHGNLSITVKNASGVGIAGIGLSGVGASTFSATTDTSGCAMLADLPEGNYTVTPTGLASSLVDQDGKPVGAFTVGVSGSTTTPVPRLYDLPGKVEKVAFKTKKADGTLINSSADTIVVFNQGMTVGEVFGTAGGTRNATFAPVSSLFPFLSPDSVYAGSCGYNNPNPKGEINPPGAAAIGSAQITANGVAPAITLQLPALYVNAWTGRSSSSKGSAFNNADVWVRDENCTNGSTKVLRRMATNAEGTLSDPGLPWGKYEVCVDTERGNGSSGVRRKSYPGISVENLSTGPLLNFYLGSGTGSESESGSCS